MLLSDFCKIYLSSMKIILAPTTYEFYTNNINKCIVPKLGQCEIENIKPADVQIYITELTQERNLAPATTKRYLTVLQSVLQLAEKQEIISSSPAAKKKLVLPKVKKPSIEIFTKNEIGAILRAAEQEPLQYRVLINLAIHTGARRGELVALQFSDFEFDRYKVTIRRAAYKPTGKPSATKPPKDYEERTVSISPYCIELVQELRKKGGIWLFTQRNGKMMNPQTPTKYWAKLLRRSGIPHKKFHALRHTSATLLLYSGISIKQVQQRLGHSSIETTEKYLHVIDEADEEASRTLTTLLENETRRKNEPKAIEIL